MQAAEWQESSRELLFVHLLPNVIGPILVSATLGVAGAILTESALSFLGLGVQLRAFVGNILTIGRDYLHMAWWLSVFPALAILVTVLALNLLGEGLRDVPGPQAMTSNLLVIENLSVTISEKVRLCSGSDFSLKVNPGEMSVWS